MLFEHLAAILPARGIAVLRFDRRDRADGNVPFAAQLADLKVALAATTDAVGAVRIGLWGASQGAWVAMLAAVGRPRIDFLILVGCSAVNPAVQMRFGTSEQARRAGFEAAEIAEIEQLRRTYESFVRGDLPCAVAQQTVEEVRDSRWFDLAWVPARLPSSPSWEDLDFDPEPIIADLDTPTLLFYGADEWVPVEQSIEIWNRSFRAGGDLTIARLADSGHLPLLDGGVRVDPEYTAVLTAWLDQRIPTA